MKLEIKEGVEVKVPKGISVMIAKILSLVEIENHARLVEYLNEARPSKESDQIDMPPFSVVLEKLDDLLQHYAHGLPFCTIPRDESIDGTFAKKIVLSILGFLARLLLVAKDKRYFQSYLVVTEFLYALDIEVVEKVVQVLSAATKTPSVIAANEDEDVKDRVEIPSVLGEAVVALFEGLGLCCPSYGMQEYIQGQDPPCSDVLERTLVIRFKDSKIAELMDARSSWLENSTFLGRRVAVNLSGEYSHLLENASYGVNIVEDCARKALDGVGCCHGSNRLESLTVLAVLRAVDGLRDPSQHARVRAAKLRLRCLAILTNSKTMSSRVLRYLKVGTPFVRDLAALADMSSDAISDLHLPRALPLSTLALDCAMVAFKTTVRSNSRIPSLNAEYQLCLCIIRGLGVLPLGVDSSQLDGSGAGGAHETPWVAVLLVACSAATKYLYERQTTTNLAPVDDVGGAAEAIECYKARLSEEEKPFLDTGDVEVTALLYLRVALELFAVCIHAHDLYVVSTEDPVVGSIVSFVQSAVAHLDSYFVNIFGSMETIIAVVTAGEKAFSVSEGDKQIMWTVSKAIACLDMSFEVPSYQPAVRESEILSSLSVVLELFSRYAIVDRPSFGISSKTVIENSLSFLARMIEHNRRTMAVDSGIQILHQPFFGKMCNQIFLSTTSDNEYLWLHMLNLLRSAITAEPNFLAQFLRTQYSKALRDIFATYRSNKFMQVQKLYLPYHTNDEMIIIPLIKLAYSVCITMEGQHFLKDSMLLGYIVQSFVNPNFLLPKSKGISADSISKCAKSLINITRDFNVSIMPGQDFCPRTAVISEVKKALLFVSKKALACARDLRFDDDSDLNSERLQTVQQVTNICALVEHMGEGRRQSTETMREILTRDVLEALVGAFACGLPPAKQLIAQLSVRNMSGNAFPSVGSAAMSKAIVNVLKLAVNIPSSGLQSILFDAVDATLGIIGQTKEALKVAFLLVSTTTAAAAATASEKPSAQSIVSPVKSFSGSQGESSALADLIPPPQRRRRGRSKDFTTPTQTASKSQQGVTASSATGSPGGGANVHVLGMLDWIPHVCVFDSWVNTNLSADFIANLWKFLRSVTTLDWIASVMVHTLRPSLRTTLDRSTFEQKKEINTIKKRLFPFQRSALLEVCRFATTKWRPEPLHSCRNKKALIDSFATFDSSEDGIPGDGSAAAAMPFPQRVPGSYRLRVVSPDGALVRENCEIEGARAVLLVNPGSEFVATQRIQAQSGVVRYKMPHGWMSEHMRDKLREPFLEILELLPAEASSDDEKFSCSGRVTTERTAEALTLRELTCSALSNAVMSLRQVFINLSRSLGVSGTVTGTKEDKEWCTMLSSTLSKVVGSYFSSASDFMTEDGSKEMISLPQSLSKFRGDESSPSSSRSPAVHIPLQNIRKDHAKYPSFGDEEGLFQSISSMNAGTGDKVKVSLAALCLYYGAVTKYMVLPLIEDRNANLNVNLLCRLQSQDVLDQFFSLLPFLLSTLYDAIKEIRVGNKGTGNNVSLCLSVAGRCALDALPSVLLLIRKFAQSNAYVREPLLVAVEELGLSPDQFVFSILTKLSNVLLPIFSEKLISTIDFPCDVQESWLALIGDLILSLRSPLPAPAITNVAKNEKETSIVASDSSSWQNHSRGSDSNAPAAGISDSSRARDAFRRYTTGVPNELDRLLVSHVSGIDPASASYSEDLLRLLMSADADADGVNQDASNSPGVISASESNGLASESAGATSEVGVHPSRGVLQTLSHEASFPPMPPQYVRSVRSVADQDISSATSSRTAGGVTDASSSVSLEAMRPLLFRMDARFTAMADNQEMLNTMQNRVAATNRISHTPVTNTNEISVLSGPLNTEGFQNWAGVGYQTPFPFNDTASNHPPPPAAAAPPIRPTAESAPRSTRNQSMSRHRRGGLGSSSDFDRVAATPEPNHRKSSSSIGGEKIGDKTGADVTLNMMMTQKLQNYAIAFSSAAHENIINVTVLSREMSEWELSDVAALAPKFSAFLAQLDRGTTDAALVSADSEKVPTMKDFFCTLVDAVINTDLYYAHTLYGSLHLLLCLFHNERARAEGGSLLSKSVAISVVEKLNSLMNASLEVLRVGGESEAWIAPALLFIHDILSLRPLEEEQRATEFSGDISEDVEAVVARLIEQSQNSDYLVPPSMLAVLLETTIKLVKLSEGAALSYESCWSVLILLSNLLCHQTLADRFVDAGAFNNLLKMSLPSSPSKNSATLWLLTQILIRCLETATELKINMSSAIRAHIQNLPTKSIPLADFLVFSDSFVQRSATCFTAAVLSVVQIQRLVPSEGADVDLSSLPITVTLKSDDVVTAAVEKWAAEVCKKDSRGVKVLTDVVKRLVSFSTQDPGDSDGETNTNLFKVSDILDSLSECNFMLSGVPIYVSSNELFASAYAAESSSSTNDVAIFGTENLSDWVIWKYLCEDGCAALNARPQSEAAESKDSTYQIELRAAFRFLVTLCMHKAASGRRVVLKAIIKNVRIASSSQQGTSGGLLQKGGSAAEARRVKALARLNILAFSSVRASAFQPQVSTKRPETAVRPNISLEALCYLISSGLADPMVKCLDSIPLEDSATAADSINSILVNLELMTQSQITKFCVQGMEFVRSGAISSMTAVTTAAVAVAEEAGSMNHEPVHNPPQNGFDDVVDAHSNFVAEHEHVSFPGDEHDEEDESMVEDDEEDDGDDLHDDEDEDDDDIDLDDEALGFMHDMGDDEDDEEAILNAGMNEAASGLANGGLSDSVYRTSPGDEHVNASSDMSFPLNQLRNLLSMENLQEGLIDDIINHASESLHDTNLALDLADDWVAIERPLVMRGGRVLQLPLDDLGHSAIHLLDISEDLREVSRTAVELLPGGLERALQSSFQIAGNGSIHPLLARVEGIRTPENGSIPYPTPQRLRTPPIGAGPPIRADFVVRSAQSAADIMRQEFAAVDSIERAMLLHEQQNATSGGGIDWSTPEFTSGELEHERDRDFDPFLRDLMAARMPPSLSGGRSPHGANQRATAPPHAQVVTVVAPVSRLSNDIDRLIRSRLVIDIHVEPPTTTSAIVADELSSQMESRYRNLDEDMRDTAEVGDTREAATGTMDVLEASFPIDVLPAAAVATAVTSSEDTVVSVESNNESVEGTFNRLDLSAIPAVDATLLASSPTLSGDILVNLDFSSLIETISATAVNPEVGEEDDLQAAVEMSLSGSFGLDQNDDHTVRAALPLETLLPSLVVVSEPPLILSAEALGSIEENGTTATRDAEDAGTNNNNAEAADAAEAARSGNAELNRLIPCPEGYEPEVFYSLPEFMQLEISEQYGESNSQQMRELAESAGYDYETIAALPENIQREILDQARQQQVAAGGGGSAIDNTSNGAVAVSSDLSHAQEMDTASFLASLTPELRAEVLMTADSAFLASLPPEMIAEAHMHQERAAVQWQRREMISTAAGAVSTIGMSGVGSSVDSSPIGGGAATDGASLRRAGGATAARGGVQLAASRWGDLEMSSAGTAGARLSRIPSGQVPMGLLVNSFCRAGKMRLPVDDCHGVTLSRKVAVVILRLLHAVDIPLNSRALTGLLGNLCRCPEMRDLTLRLLIACVTMDVDALEDVVEEIKSSDPAFCGIARENFEVQQISRSSLTNQIIGRIIIVISRLAESPQILYDMLRARTIADSKVAVLQSSSLPFLGKISLSSETPTDSSRSLLEEIFHLYAHPQLSADPTVLASITSLISKVTAPLDFIGEAPESEEDNPTDANKWDKLADIPRVRISEDSLRYISDVLSNDFCSKSVCSTVTVIISRLAKIPSNAEILTQQILFVLIDLVAESEVRLLALSKSLDELLPEERPPTLKLSATRLPLGGSGVRHHQRTLRSLQTLKLVSQQRKQKLIDVIGSTDLGRMWIALDMVMWRLKYFFVDEEDMQQTSGGVHRPRAQATMTSLVSRLLPAIEAFFLVNAIDVSDPIVPSADSSTAHLASDMYVAAADADASPPATLRASPPPAPSPVAGAAALPTPGERYRSTAVYQEFNRSLSALSGSEDGGSLHLQRTVSLRSRGGRVDSFVRSASLTRTLSSLDRSSGIALLCSDLPQLRASRLSTFTVSHKELLNLVVRSRPSLLDNSLSCLVRVVQLRSYLDFDNKRKHFFTQLSRARSRSPRGASRHTVHLHLRRDRVFEDSFQQLRMRTAAEMQGRLRINFYGEEGIDAGGLTREWYMVLAREIFNPNYALFTAAVDGATFQPNPNSMINTNHLDYFKFVGRIIGKAVCDGHLMDAHFTRSFYKHVLGTRVDYTDIEAVEPDYYKSLKQILEYSLDDLGLELTFSAEKHSFGRIEVVDLIPRGRFIPVTEENKEDYVRLIAHHRMTAAIRSQIECFLDGFYDVVPPELISIFSPTELELLICGLPDVDIDDLCAHTDYHQFRETEDTIVWFWEVLRAFNREERALFLQFVTGTSKVPLEGFASLQGMRGPQRFSIHRMHVGNGALPSAHTCFNQLDLPVYSSKEELQTKLLLAIKEGSEGFGFA